MTFNPVRNLKYGSLATSPMTNPRPLHTLNFDQTNQTALRTIRRFRNKSATNIHTKIVPALRIELQPFP